MKQRRQQDAAAKPIERKKLWFRVVALVAIPLVLLLLLEAILGLTGFGYSTCFFRKRQLQGQTVWTENLDFGRRFFPPGLTRRAEPFVLASNKSTNTLRVLVLGESAAMGDPDFKFGLPRMLEVLLRERFPNRKVELINAAMVAINSHVILPIAQDSVAHQADLWVVYMGNNEMVGPFGSASIFGARAPALWVIKACLWLKQTRGGQLLDAGLQRLGRRGRKLPEWSGMEMMAEQKVRPDSAATAKVYENFSQNLTKLLGTAARAGVPVVLCTVADNLRDSAPFASLHRADLAQAELSSWQAAYEQGCALQKAGNWARAKAAFEKALQIDSDFAELSFRLAQCCQSLGEDARAAALYSQARDQDALQFRADSRINGLIRAAATAFAGQRVQLVDAEQLFAGNSPKGVAGAEFFYEHVHLTPEGNYLLARAVAEAAVGALELKAQRSWASLPECLRLVGLTDWNRYDAMNTILDRMQRPPFINQLDHQDQLERLSEQLSKYLPGTKPAQARTEAAQVSKQVARFPEDPDLRWNLAVLLQSCGDLAGAESQWRALRQLQPFSAMPAYNLAKLLDASGRQAEATALYDEVLKMDPANALAREQLRNCGQQRPGR